MTLGVWRTYGARDCFSWLTHRLRGGLTCDAPLALGIREAGKKQVPHTARKKRERVRDDKMGVYRAGGTVETVP
jgi:hypothetical protein